MSGQDDNTRDLINLECNYGKKLIKKFGRATASQLIDFFRVEGLPIEFPANLVDGLTLSGTPEIKLEMLDGCGNPMKTGSKDLARRHRWILSIGGQPQLTLKEFKIPKLDYSNTGPLTVKLTYYCMADEVCCPLKEIANGARQETENENGKG